MKRITEFMKKWWWTPLVPLVLVLAVLAWVWVKKAKSDAASATAIVELDVERGITGKEAEEHRKQRMAAKQRADTAVEAMGTVKNYLNETGHDKLAEYVDAWY